MQEELGKECVDHGIVVGCRLLHLLPHDLQLADQFVAQRTLLSEQQRLIQLLRAARSNDDRITPCSVQITMEPGPSVSNLRLTDASVFQKLDILLEILQKLGLVESSMVHLSNDRGPD